MARDRSERRHLFDDPGNVRFVLRLLYAICIALMLVDVVDLALRLLGAGALRHTERAWEGFAGFYPVYGWVGCVALVLIAKLLRKVVMRREDFYDR